MDLEFRDRVEKGAESGGQSTGTVSITDERRSGAAERVWRKAKPASNSAARLPRFEPRAMPTGERGRGGLVHNDDLRFPPPSPEGRRLPTRPT